MRKLVKLTLVAIVFAVVSNGLASNSIADVTIDWFGTGHHPFDSAAAEAEAISDFQTSAEALPGFISHDLETSGAFLVSGGWDGFASGTVTITDEAYITLVLLGIIPAL